VPNFVRFDASMLKLQQMIKWDVFLGHGVLWYYINARIFFADVDHVSV